MTQVGGIAGDHLLSFVERIERLNEEADALRADIKDVYSELKGVGFDPKVVRKIIRLRKMDDHLRCEMEEIEDLYRSALGMS